MALGLPNNGKIVALDKDNKTNLVAVNFLKKLVKTIKLKLL